MADGRRLEKTLNRHNSATVHQITMKLSTMAHFNPVKPTCDQKFDFLKMKIADG